MSCGDSRKRCLGGYVVLQFSKGGEDERKGSVRKPIIHRPRSTSPTQSPDGSPLVAPPRSLVSPGTRSSPHFRRKAKIPPPQQRRQESRPIRISGRSRTLTKPEALQL